MPFPESKIKTSFYHRVYSQTGQTLLEVIVAIAVGTVMIMALVALGSRSNRTVNSARLSEVASKYAQEGLEIVRAIRDNDGNIAIGAGPGISTWSSLYNFVTLGYFTNTYVLVPAGGYHATTFQQCSGSSWCLDSANTNYDSFKVSPCPSTNPSTQQWYSTFAPGTGTTTNPSTCVTTGLTLARTVVVSNNPADPDSATAAAVKACFLWDGSSYLMDPNKEQKVLSVLVKVTWTDPTGTHTTKAQDCMIDKNNT